MSKRIYPVIAGVLAFILHMGDARGQPSGEDEVFAQLGDTVLTHELLDAAFARIPPRERLLFIRDSKQVNIMVKQILRNLALADAARAEGFEQDAMVSGRMLLAATRELAEAWVDEQVRRAPEADFEALAREHYLLNKNRYWSQTTFDVTHLLIMGRERTEEEARQLAEDLLEQAQSDPASFDQLVEQHSEDPSVTSNQGRFTDVSPGQMDPDFERAALALENAGDLSGVVKSSFGYHIIRLDDRRAPRQLTFEEAKPGLIAEQEANYQEQVRSRVINQAVSKPLEVPEGAVEKMLKRYFGEDLENAPYSGG